MVFFNLYIFHEDVRLKVLNLYMSDNATEYNDSMASKLNIKFKHKPSWKSLLVFTKYL